jgi:hypothetical protein
MQSVVTVCRVKTIDIETIHEKLMGWVSVVVQARDQRLAFDNMVLLGL